jgi:hypothetical protein
MFAAERKLNHGAVPTHLVCSAWVIWTHVSIWGSIAIYFIFLLVYCIIWPNLGYTVAVNVFHVDYQMFSCAPFWYVWIEAPASAVFFPTYVAVWHCGAGAVNSLSHPLPLTFGQGSRVGLRWRNVACRFAIIAAPLVALTRDFWWKTHQRLVSPQDYHIIQEMVCNRRRIHIIYRGRAGYSRVS